MISSENRSVHGKTATYNCRCPLCRAERLRIWQAATPSLQSALQAMAHGPRTWNDLSRGARLRTQTVQRLIATDLARQLRLKGPLRDDPAIHFVTLTPLGRAVLHAGLTAERKAA